MKAQIQVYKNGDEIGRWEDERERNESLGIQRPEEEVMWNTLWFKREDLTHCFVRGDGNLCINFINDSYVAKPTTELIHVIEDYFNDK